MKIRGVEVAAGLMVLAICACLALLTNNISAPQGPVVEIQKSRGSGSEAESTLQRVTEYLLGEESKSSPEAVGTESLPPSHHTGVVVANALKKIAKTDVQKQLVEMSTSQVMTVERCKQLLCTQQPAIVDDGPSLAMWQQQHDELSSQFKSVSQAKMVEECVAKIQEHSGSKGQTIDWRASTECEFGKEESAKDMQEVAKVLEGDVADDKELSKDALEEKIHEKTAAGEDKQQAAVDVAQEAAESWMNKQFKNFEALQKELTLDVSLKHEQESASHATAEREDPNSESWESPDMASPNCDELPPVPGVEFLFSGYDPAATTAGGGTCTFDQCMTRQIYIFTYEQCKTTHTPAGTFKVPDQVYVMPKYETTADTKVYPSLSAMEEQLARDAGVSSDTDVGAPEAEEAFHSSDGANGLAMAQRKVNIALYELTGKPKSWDVTQEFIEDLKVLPAKFRNGEKQYFDFLKKWGRFTVEKCDYGGTLAVNMVFHAGKGGKDVSKGVNQVLDSVFSSPAGGPPKNSVYDNCQINLEANGGDPSIAAAITDYDARSRNTATFRTDFIAWIQSIPLYPKVVNAVPRLHPITRLIPEETPRDPGAPKWTAKQKEQDKIRWESKRIAMNEAMEVIGLSPLDALRNDQKECSVIVSAPQLTWPSPPSHKLAHASEYKPRSILWPHFCSKYQQISGTQASVQIQSCGLKMFKTQPGKGQSDTDVLCVLGRKR